LPIVKENADFVTTYDHNNDGVIEFLKDYLNDYGSSESCILAN